MFHVSQVRNAVYCGRQAYYESQREACRLPSPETRVLRELAYVYPTVVESPDEAVRHACEVAGVEVEIDVSDTSEKLAEVRDKRPSVWDDIARPDREERYVESDRLRGTVDKLSFGEDGVTVSVVKTGEPPARGVWSSARIEAAAVRRLVSARHDVRRVVVEYPRVGAVREVEVGRDDERALGRALEKLEDIKEGVPPARTDNRAKCESCEFSDECGVETRSLLTRLRDRFG
ncbi:MAG: Dna2/Cas4 domain-containing protein [Halobacteriales archaeon]